MGTLATVATVVLSISFVTFVAFFGRLPVFRRTPIAWLHRLLLVHIPGGILALDQRLTSGKFTSSLQWFGNYMINERHPTVLIFFVLLLLVCECMAVPAAWSLLSGFQRAAVVVFIVLPYAFLYLAATADPGTVSLSNLPHHMLQYPYDYALFHPGARCSTCNLLKPPRSKHCPLCKRCVARLDHHCVFINNCVGAGNHHWFLLLLLATGLLASYGGLVGVQLIADHVREQYPTFSLLPWRAREAGPPPTKPLPLHLWITLATWGLRDMVHLGSVSLLALLTSPLVWGLLAYNLWNVYTGQTTNESLKWADWQYDIRDGCVFRRRLHRDRDDSPAAASLTRWPVEAQHVLIHSENGLVPPAEGTGMPGVGAWEPVRRLRDVDNLYDIGFWNNLADVFVPGHSFLASGLPSVESRGRTRMRRPRPS